MGSKLANKIVVDVVEEVWEELTEFLYSDRSSVDALYLVRLLNGHLYKMGDMLSADALAYYGMDRGEFRDLASRVEVYMRDVRAVYDELVMSNDRDDGTTLLDEYVAGLGERKYHFEYADEFESYMRTFLGNHAFRESVVRKNRVWLWRNLFDRLDEDFYTPMEYISVMNWMKEIERSLIFSSGYRNLDESGETWKFRSVYMSDEAKYDRAKEMFAEGLGEMAEFLITLFSKPIAD